MDTREARFMELLAANQGILYKICRTYQDAAEDQNDLMQEIILLLWRSYDSFRAESALSTWLYRVALNTAIVFFKTQKRRSEHIALSPEFNQQHETGSQTEKEQQLQLFYRAVLQLDRVEKALVVLYMEGKSSQEIAASLGLSAVNARVRVGRVKNKLRAIIKTMGYEY